MNIMKKIKYKVQKILKMIIFKKKRKRENKIKKNNSQKNHFKN